MTNEESLLWKVQTPNFECWVSKDLQTEGGEKKKEEERDEQRAKRWGQRFFLPSVSAGNTASHN